MTHYAILIGNAIFPDEPDPCKLPPLPAALHDIVGLQAALTDGEHGLFLAENIVQVQDETREVILEKVDELLSRAKETEDLVLLYYSGHGWLDRDSRLYLMTRNTKVNHLHINAIRFDHLYHSIKNAKANKRIVILDCCYSGAAIDGVFKGDDDLALKAGLDKINATAEGTYLLTASASLQVAGASSDDSNYSLFTHHLIDGLKGKAQADEQAQIPLDNLFNYVHDAVKTISSQKTPEGKLRRPQIPHLAAPRVKGTLYLAKSGRDSRHERAEKLEKYLLDLKRDKRISNDMLSAALALIEKPTSVLSATEKAQDALLDDCFASQDALQLMRNWDKLTAAPEPVKPVPPPAPPTPQIPSKPPASSKPLIDSSGSGGSEKRPLNLKLVRWGGGGVFALLAAMVFFIPSEQVMTPVEAPAPAPAVVEIFAASAPAAVVEAPAPAAPVAAPARQSYEPEMMPISSGNFNMGSTDGESDEKPVHTVNVGRFELGKTEVTQGQWKAVMGSNPSRFEDCGDTCPVEQVSWDDAQSFIQKLNQMTDKQYRLPSESEWEYAYRAGTTTAFYTGNCIHTDQANYDGKNADYNNCGAKTGVYKEKTVRVGSYPANPFGLHDMAGNVWEWVQDTYHGTYSGAPTDGSAWEGSRAGARVLRGGSWFNYPQIVRAAIRISGTATVRDFNIGFRLARTLP